MDKDKILFVIDPGHGGNDPGAVANGIEEKDANLVEALAIRDELKKYDNVDVIMTRSTDKTLSLSARVNFANEYVGDYETVVFISNHKNAGGGNGIEIYGNTKNAKAKKVAAAIGKQAEKIGQNLRDPLFRDGMDLYVIKNTKMTALLIESAFLDNKTDVKIIDTKSEQKTFGVAIAKGIADAYDLKKKDEKVLKKGAKCKIKAGAKDLNTGKKYKNFVHEKTYTVISVSGNRVVFGQNGAVTGATSKSNIKLI